MDPVPYVKLIGLDAIAGGSPYGRHHNCSSGSMLLTGRLAGAAQLGVGTLRAPAAAGVRTPAGVHLGRCLLNGKMNLRGDCGERSRGELPAGRPGTPGQPGRRLARSRVEGIDDPSLSAHTYL